MLKRNVVHSLICRLLRLKTDGREIVTVYKIRCIKLKSYLDDYEIKYSIICPNQLEFYTILQCNLTRRNFVIEI